MEKEEAEIKIHNQKKNENRKTKREVKKEEKNKHKNCKKQQQSACIERTTKSTEETQSKKEK